MAGSQMGTGAVGARRARWLEREGIAGYRRARWQLLGQWGGRMVAGGGSSRWGQPVTKSGGKGQLEARGGSKSQMGWGTGGRMMAVRHWGGIPDRGGWVPDRDGGIPDRGGVPDRDGGIPDRGGGIPDRGGGVPDRMMVAFQTWMVGFQTGMMGFQIWMVEFQTRMVGFQTGMVGFQTGDGIPDAMRF